MKTLRAVTLLLAATALMPAMAQAGVVVIANPGTPVASMNKDDVLQLFLGRSSNLPDGTRAVTFDFPEGEATRVQFAERVLGKSEQQLRSHWTRMIFTGKGQPPRTVNSAADMVRQVAGTPGAVGYVDSSEVSPRVKVLLRIE